MLRTSFTIISFANEPVYLAVFGVCELPCESKGRGMKLCVSFKISPVYFLFLVLGNSDRMEGMLHIDSSGAQQPLFTQTFNLLYREST